MTAHPGVNLGSARAPSVWLLTCHDWIVTWERVCPNVAVAWPPTTGTSITNKAGSQGGRGQSCQLVQQAPKLRSKTCMSLLVAVSEATPGTKCNCTFSRHKRQTCPPHRAPAIQAQITTARFKQRQIVSYAYQVSAHVVRVTHMWSHQYRPRSCAKTASKAQTQFCRRLQLGQSTEHCSPRTTDVYVTGTLEACLHRQPSAYIAAPRGGSTLPSPVNTVNPDVNPEKALVPATAKWC